MMMDAIKHARVMHRKAIESAYEGICRIYERQSCKDPVTKVTTLKEIQVQDSLPCRLSFSGGASAVATETAANVSQTIKLFLNPETVVKPGSRIEVTQLGRTEVYEQSGKAAVYSSHQEIVLELWKGYV